MPFMPAVTAVRVSVVLVAPLRFVKVAPPSVLCCHCTVGAGLPEAAEVKLAAPPRLAV